ncbi:hypothetical protein VNO77_31789 [Canavalia gladiata]|uniref:Uncharacterized protein n=1 Tax=Canavalia gladiata TaxID=3824 RepID=A0AAN9KSR6_CANGL
MIEILVRELQWIYCICVCLIQLVVEHLAWFLHRIWLWSMYYIQSRDVMYYNVMVSFVFITNNNLYLNLSC